MRIRSLEVAYRALLAAVDNAQDAVTQIRTPGSNFYITKALLDKASSEIHEAELTIILASGPDAEVLQATETQVIVPFNEFARLVNEGKKPEAEDLALRMGDGILELRALVFRALEAERKAL